MDLDINSNVNNECLNIFIIKKNLLKNRPPTKEKLIDENQSKSFNILPSMKKDEKD